jgi:hypothetical protein
MIEYTDIGITALDYVLLPFYLFAIFKIAFFYRDKYYPENNPLRPYFIPGLMAKIGGAIFIGLIYNYYYSGGDTFNFFYITKLINSTLIETPDTWLRLITHNANDANLTDAQIISKMYWYDDTPSYTTACLAAFIGLFCFTKYLLINVIIASIVFIGTWLMFITFAKQYKNIKTIAIAILFMPGPIVWGSGLFKDSFCMFAIGCLVYCFYMLFELRKYKLWLIFLALLSITLLALIKAYIIVALFPVLLLKTILVYKKRVTLYPNKKPAFYIILSILSFLGLILLSKVAIYLSSFTMENVMATVIHQKEYLLRVSLEQDGAAYDLGDFDPSLKGILSKIPTAINVALFRPYLWESKSIIQFFNSLESTCILLLTLYLIIRKNIFQTIKNIYNDPNLIMCIIFALIFAFFVGISSYNFGSLSRYKIPCTPFYMCFLMILIFEDKDVKTEENKADGLESV